MDEDILVQLVEAMKDVPRIHEMCAEVGVSWDEVKVLIRARAKEWGVKGQQVLNFTMLGAAIGYLYGAQRKVNSADSDTTH